MASQLQEAISATRNGELIEAQKILADILKADTENVHAWYLLALLVDSPEKKQAYLNRVLNLDPDHEKANEAIAAMAQIDGTSSALGEREALPDGAEETAVSGSAAIEDAAESGQVTSLPSWLEEEKTDVPHGVLIEEEPSEIFNADLPDWLSAESSPVNIQDEPPTLLSESPPQELEAMLAENDQQTETVVLSTPEQETPQISKSDEPTALEIISHPTPSPARPWNIALIFLVLFTILTLIAILLQLSRLL